ncbi:hypothetical protein TeGR_g3801 [Tetraparma gracilis]|uniref:DUF6875 domain-containing protein n=1 Tax=Tetraparma gracilis TaxID=2962635 RepID=A0ABQ6N7T5_9STRA|nr:hypothetical protein TeGR_g3801 [Tetraparma gracilis]
MAQPLHPPASPPPSRRVSDPSVPRAVVTEVSTGAEIFLDQLWTDRKVVVVFLRQLGCRFCLKQVAELQDFRLYEKLAANDVHLVCVSLGSVSVGKQWLKETKFQGSLYLDTSTSGDVNSVEQPQSRPYAAFRLKRGVGVLRLDDPAAQAASEKVYEKHPDRADWGSKDGEMVVWPGDVYQTGGAFVLGPGNLCDFAFRSAFAGDHVDLPGLLKFATGSTPDGQEVVYESTANWVSRLRNYTRLEVSDYGVVSAENNSVGGKLAKIAVASSYKMKGYRGHLLAAGGALGSYWFFSSRTPPPRFLSAILLGWRWPPSRSLGVSARPLFSYAGVGLLASFVYASARVGMKLALRMSKGGLRYIDAKADVTLLTPVDIDRKVLESGLPECDCGSAIDTEAMMGQVEVGGEVSEKGKSMGRSRSQTWASEIYDSNEFQSILCYVREFLAKPHPGVGRGGPVCPFVPTSLKKNCIYMSVIRTSALVDGENAAPLMDDKEKEEAVRKILAKLLMDFIPIFETLEPATGKVRQFKAIILIFPDIKNSQAHNIIDEVQVRVKEMFVEKGLMCGEFHATNNASGLRNKNFFPLRTPYPCLAIRHMVPGDIAFMDLENYELKLRVKLIRGFLDIFGDEDKPQVHEARKKLEETEREIALQSN